ncbi:class I SAM-dependent methyltransferase [Planktothrix mougeotii]|uniref:Class I SAM-dependent methyltransferase n=1 Tax=Planktothrix mougeotii LEGE 06226 TaxID=1828728 RepID=A0ABR9UJB1_9CYAN|nr:class I SAM-dependent methyltransferase [Planktothrix mougeotii]MBE9145906.1 class I SAM-dependent methyltransferase [Planktothrix mougeotii LEGE 06226]
MDTQAHWQKVYTTKNSTEVSWFQKHLELSLEFIKRTKVDKAGYIIDVGGGTSTLVDDLLADGFRAVTVLDISAEAVQVAQKRLGSRANSVTWLESDIRQVHLPHHFYDIWHDRAVFHFLTDVQDRQLYLDTVKHCVKPGGHMIIATFALDGPNRCSGLEVVRYSLDSLHEQFRNDFELVDSTNETHKTPFGTEQKFIYCYWRKR